MKSLNALKCHKEHFWDHNLFNSGVGVQHSNACQKTSNFGEQKNLNSHNNGPLKIQETV